MADITPSRYTSETSFDVEIPVSTAGSYSIDVTNSSGLGSTPFTVNPAVSLTLTDLENRVGDTVTSLVVGLDLVTIGTEFTASSEVRFAGATTTDIVPTFIDSTKLIVDTSTLTSGAYTVTVFEGVDESNGLPLTMIAADTRLNDPKLLLCM